MKYSLLLLVGFVLFGSCKQKTDTTTERNSYSIAGTIRGLKQGDVVILEYIAADRKPDTAKLQGSQFTFEGTVKEPFMGFISVNDGLGRSYGGIDLVIENADIKIDANKDSLANAVVKGSTATDDLYTLKQTLNTFTTRLKSISDNADALQDKDTAAFRKVEQEYYTVTAERVKSIKQFAIEHPKSVVSAFYAYQDLSGNIEDKTLDSIYNSFDEPVKNSVYGKKINQLLAAIRRVEMGDAAPELNLPDENGFIVQLSSYKGKVVLIDFWASWCGPCRKENPNVVSAYNRFKAKGFDVLGVSLDNDKDAWQQAIAKDNLAWKHVSDLKQWESSAVALYGLSAIPANVLLDRNGKIIAKDLHGEQLEAKLHELMPDAAP